ncbi:MAG TPA: outer membrane beta-barrel protein [Xanthobacteraceae bacterium]|nr:outer membrane beta-barrel protein [Xanthobacteraceae bacterium]
MRRGDLICFGFLVGVSATAVSSAAAQVAPGSGTGYGNDVWQTGAPAVPALYSARQTPNNTPSAPSGPAGSQSAQSGWPSWYPQAPGTPWAGGTLFTGITAGTFFDDNVFAANSNKQSDWAFFARPEAQWVRQGQNYTFAADGWLEGRSYARFSSENQVNGGAGAHFTIMPDNDTQIVAGARYLHEHLDRGSSETVVVIPGVGSELLSTQFAHPVAYDEGLQSVALNKRNGNWWSSIGGAGLEIQYQNPAIGGAGAALAGTPIDLGYADGGIGIVNARLGYVVAPRTSVFVEAAGNTRDWDVSYFNSTGYRLVAGMLFEQGPGARLKGEVWGGYMNQSYNGTTMAGVSSWTYGLGLAALLTDNVTAVFEGRREAKEAALGLAVLPDGALGADAPTCTADVAVCVSDVESEIGGRVDVHIAPNVVVGAGGSYLEDDYQGPLAFDRIDRSYGPLASIKYFATPNVTLGFDYRNLQFSSKGGVAPAGFTAVTALPYMKNVYLFSVNARW